MNRPVVEIAEHRLEDAQCRRRDDEISLVSVEEGGESGRLRLVPEWPDALPRSTGLP